MLPVVLTRSATSSRIPSPCANAWQRNDLEIPQTVHMEWICGPCKERRHDSCQGRSHCYCQHRVRQPREPVTGTLGETG